METLVSKGLLAFCYGFAFCGSAVLAAETETEEAPEMEFVEYLGMWEESDEDWQALNIEQLAEEDERSDPVPEGEESTENDDES